MRACRVPGYREHGVLHTSGQLSTTQGAPGTSTKSILIQISPDIRMAIDLEHDISQICEIERDISQISPSAPYSGAVTTQRAAA